MSSSRRRAALLTGALAGACGGGSPSGPSLPAVAGRYSGRVSYVSAVPDTDCYAAFLRSLGRGHSYLVEVEVQQDGGRLEGTLTGTQIQTACRFSGDVQAGGAAWWQQTSCAVACTVFQDGPCAARRVCVAGHAFEGTASGSRLEGRHTVIWDMFDPGTGAPLGRLEISGTLQVDRAAR